MNRDQRYHRSDYESTVHNLGLLVEDMFPGRDWQTAELRYSLKRMCRALVRSGWETTYIEKCLRDMKEWRIDHG